VVEYLLGIIIKKNDVFMWDPFKTSNVKVSIVDALRALVKKLKVKTLSCEPIWNNVVAEHLTKEEKCFVWTVVVDVRGDD